MPNDANDVICGAFQSLHHPCILTLHSQGICFSYAGLRSVKYTAQLWLLDSYHWWCASDQFCPYRLDIDNSNGQNSAVRDTALFCLLAVLIPLLGHLMYRYASADQLPQRGLSVAC